MVEKPHHDFGQTRAHRCKQWSRLITGNEPGTRTAIDWGSGREQRL